MPVPSSPDAKAQIQDRIRECRREAARASIEAFARIYLGAHFSQPPSPMHCDLFAFLQAASTDRNARLAIAAPRGHAKSTVTSLAYILWSICFGFEPFIVLISNTADQASDLLAGVKAELESNPLLLEDFPEAAEPPGSKPTPERWRRTEIITRNAVRVIALGSGQRIRGRKHREHRPSLIILDDVENESEVLSADLRENRLSWFNKSVMKAGTTAKTNVVAVGTLLHFDSLLSRLVREPGTAEMIPGWTARKYRAVISWASRTELWEQWIAIYSFRAEHEGAGGAEAAKAFFDANREAMLDGSSVLWPERESYYQLMELRLREGEASFDSEKQNDPIDLKSCFFDPAKIHYWDDQYRSVEDLIRDLGSNSFIYGACDPSLGREGKSRDDTAIVTVLIHNPTGIMYVLDADIRKRKPLEIIHAIIEYNRVRQFEYFAMETNQFQEFLATELKRVSGQRGIQIPVFKINHSSDKLGRIQSLEPMITSGFLRFSKQHRQLIEQLRQFPKGAHDDGPDALEMAVQVCRRPRPGIFWVEGSL
jgi:predicted phage terminase large subunit-like protein